MKKKSEKRVFSIKIPEKDFSKIERQLEKIREEKSYFPTKQQWISEVISNQIRADLQKLKNVQEVNESDQKFKKVTVWIDKKLDEQIDHILRLTRSAEKRSISKSQWLLKAILDEVETLTEKDETKELTRL